MIRRWTLLALMTVSASLAAAGQDWPQWRGPNRDCVVPGGPTLSETWPRKGLTPLWTSEKIPSANAGGYGSVVVADGRVYLLATPRWKEPIANRPLDRRWGGRLGYVPPAKRPPAELDRKVEAARCSEERAKLSRREVGAWIKKFLADNLTTDEDKKKYTKIINKRLADGARALTWEQLDKVAARKNKGFADQAALDKWLDESGFTGDVRKAVAGQFATTKDVSSNQLWCLDATDGKKLWCKEYPGAPRTYGGSNTPTVADGKVYAIGTTSMAYCLDAATGEEVWTYQGRGNERSCSFLLVDGKAIAPLGPLTALDPAKGEVVWKQPKIDAAHQSPIAWTHEGKTYLICNTDRNVFCVDPKDGAILWQEQGGGWGTPAIDGDRMVILSGSRAKNLLCYTLAPDKAEKAWAVPAKGDRCASPTIWKDHVYVFQSKRGLCVNLSDGKVCWDEKTGTTENGSTVVVDGKLVSIGGGGKVLYLTKAVADKYTPLAKCRAGLTDCATPAIVDGRMYVRRKNDVACYDLTTPAHEEAAPKR